METVISDREARENIRDNVRRLLRDRGWTQVALAEKTGVRQATISRIVNGLHVPNVVVLARIAEAFDVSLDRLLAKAPEKILAES